MESAPPYVTTPTLPMEIKPEWETRLLEKARRQRARKKPCSLVVVFHPDGTTTYFVGEADGRVTP